MVVLFVEPVLFSCRFNALVWKAITFLCGHSLLHDVVSPLCGFIIMWCGFTIMWCDFIIVWWGFTITWCGFVIMCCGFTIMWCGFIIMWCGFTITWCGFVIMWFCHYVMWFRHNVISWHILHVRMPYMHPGIYGYLVSKETVVLRWWGRSKQKFGFIKRVDKCWITTVKDLESWPLVR